MSEMMTVHRADYKPYPFVVHELHLSFDLQDDYVEVTSAMKLERQDSGPLHLYGDSLELLTVELDDKPLKHQHYELLEDDLIILDCPKKPFHLTIKTRIYPKDNTELSGLYWVNGLFCTQCEAEGFRRITYFPDRPDVLTRYTTRICADKIKYPVLLSNGNCIDSGEAESGRHWVIWEDPFKKPSYLFALVAGDLKVVTDSFVTASGKTVDLRLYVEAGNEDKCAHALASLKKAMRWDEVEYGREYDLETFMIVAVSDFNMGAMENKGLNIFNAKYILARPDTATDEDYAAIEGVVAHEYFHNWTGNRVTCRDWFQLSLKEGLTVFRDQEFSRDMNSRDVNRILDVKLLFNAQFPEDAGAMAHPVRPESYQEINNFYTATVYNKGAEVIRMQHTLLGKEGSRRGMDLYFDRHDGQAVTIDDFVSAMEEANEVDLSQFKRWYSQAGTPQVTVKTDYEAGVLTLVLTQTCRATDECQHKKPFHIPISIALWDSQGAPMPIPQTVLELREATQTFRFEGLSEKPLVSLLRGFSAPVQLHHPLTESENIALLRHETDGFAKWNAAQILALGVVTQLYALPKDSWVLPETLCDAYRVSAEDGRVDAALRAELLTPPGFESLVAHLTSVDVLRLETARDWFRAHLGKQLYPTFQAHYETLWAEEDNAMDAEAYKRRKWQNRCLWFMMKSNENQALPYCTEQFRLAQTMTTQLASFGLLVNSTDETLRLKAIEDFYQQWSHDTLVLDKWFALQAMSELPGALSRVEALLSHPAFTFKNPNKVRALIGAFCQGNPRHFHAPDGSGYAFLSDMLLKIDGLNSQIAARLATPFTRWQRLDERRQDLMKDILTSLAQKNLSRDLREMVTKSLKG